MVRDSVALTDVADARRHLGISPCRHVREEVVLDLEAEMAAEHMGEAAGLEVARTEHLAEVPAGPVLAHQIFLTESGRPLREVAAVDHRVRPHISQSIREGVSGDHLGRERAGERRVKHILDEVLGTRLFHQ